MDAEELGALANKFECFRQYVEVELEQLGNRIKQLEGHEEEKDTDEDYEMFNGGGRNH